MTRAEIIALQKQLLLAGYNVAVDGVSGTFMPAVPA